MCHLTPASAEVPERAGQAYGRRLLRRASSLDNRREGGPGYRDHATVQSGRSHIHRAPGEVSQIHSSFFSIPGLRSLMCEADRSLGAICLSWRLRPVTRRIVLLPARVHTFCNDTILSLSARAMFRTNLKLISMMKECHVAIQFCLEFSLAYSRVCGGGLEHTMCQHRMLNNFDGSQSQGLDGLVSASLLCPLSPPT